MNTTNLFVELMVIGIGALSAVFLGVFAFMTLDASLLATLVADNVATILILAPVLALTYVLGIVVDRGADWLFKLLWTDDYRERYFKDDINTYHRARRAVMIGPEKLASMIEYARSRMRICRGWTVNTAFFFIAWNLFASRQLAGGSSEVPWWTIGNVFLLVLLVGCWLAWRSLVLGMYVKVKRKHTFLIEQGLVRPAPTEPHTLEEEAGDDEQPSK